jgi:hypothetical protein
MIAALANAFVPIFAGLLVGRLAGLWKFVEPAFFQWFILTFSRIDQTGNSQGSPDRSERQSDHQEILRPLRSRQNFVGLVGTE